MGKLPTKGAGMVARGPRLRGEASPHLFAALRDRYGIRDGDGTNVHDLGGSSNLNLLLTDTDAAGPRRYVVRVYRPWVTAARLADMQLVRRQLAQGGVPCALPVSTLDGEPWIVVDGRLVEVEPYIEHDAKMDSWQRLETGLPLLGRIHTLLQPLHVSEDGRNAPAANHIEPQDVLSATLLGTQRIGQWHDASPVELQLAGASEELARLVDRQQRALGIEGLSRQLVHGDYWDNNVLFRDGRIVLVADLDFMGERPRVDDLALTLYYTNSTFSDDPTSNERIHSLRRLVDAYDAGLDEALTSAERAALPLVLARTPLAFIAMIASVDSEAGARRLASEMAPDISWALAIARDLERWQSVFA
jgi:Ser/Thr protein kinase RdoA (MazF antagonist)